MWQHLINVRGLCYRVIAPVDLGIYVSNCWTGKWTGRVEWSMEWTMEFLNLKHFFIEIPGSATYEWHNWHLSHVTLLYHVQGSNSRDKE